MKKPVREDWTVLSSLALTTLGFIIAVINFVCRQNFRFRVFAFVGFNFLLLAGGSVPMKVRLELKKKAGFGSLTGTARLQMATKHQLVKDGLYKSIRHPLYFWEILRNLGFVIIFSSVYGMLIVLLASFFLLFRIEIEEKMLWEYYILSK